jgi:hypothetical protein
MGCLGAVEENALQDAPQERASISISEGSLGTQCNQCSSTERVERDSLSRPRCLRRKRACIRLLCLFWIPANDTWQQVGAVCCALTPSGKGYSEWSRDCSSSPPLLDCHTLRKVEEGWRNEGGEAGGVEERRTFYGSSTRTHPPSGKKCSVVAVV